VVVAVLAVVVLAAVVVLVVAAKRNRSSDAPGGEGLLSPSLPNRHPQTRGLICVA
jgi:hypothetical protein